jgi:cysteinyl-tRNA synthetase
MTEILGINPHSPDWRSTASAPADRALASLVERLIEDRENAREARDFVAADRIRDELAAAGITVEDSPTGTHWTIEP